VLLVHSQAATTSKLSALCRWRTCFSSQFRSRPRCLHRQRSRSGHPRLENCVTLLRCTPPASSPSSLRHRRLLSFTGCVACTLQARLRQFRPGRASGISTTATPVHSQRCSSSGVSSTPLGPCHRRPCNSELAASTTAGRLQGDCHGVSCITLSSTTLSEPASSRL